MKPLTSLKHVARTLALTAAVTFAVVGIGAGTARADILLDTTVSPNPLIAPAGGGLFNWDYDFIVTGSQHIATDDFFTIYDFLGLSSVVAPAGWSSSVQLVGVTPFGVTPIDHPGIDNVTFAYKGVPDIVGETSLGTFRLISTLDTPVQGFFNLGGRGTLNGVNLKHANVSHVPVPSAVPEPATIALLGMGVLPLFTKLRRQRTA